MDTARRTRQAADWPVAIQERYGVRQRSPWSTAMVIGLVLAVVGGGTWLAWQRVNPQIAAGVTSYRTLADDHMEITWDVQRQPASGAVCVLRARASDGFDVAYTEVTLPAASGRTTHVYQLRTAYRALVGEVLGCGGDAPPSGIPGAQYRPGVLPPEQPWSQAGDM